ncbi:UBP43 hydrolase, partial [Penelope pileata]|nr:UBP43 hydrolase [Penelope pileata]
GLRNHGNTCFMNAVVQCLSNTAPLAEFLALGRYRARGARAEVTHRLAALVRALWSLEYTPRLSAEFKSIVAKHSAQFRGNAQHDALEFLLWLLDRMHEDLGAASPVPGPRAAHQHGVGAGCCADAGLLPPPPQPGAEQSGASFVQSHFQAQYRSSLTCPHCRRQSNTFDPFLCISLPIPARQTRALNVTLVLQREGGRSVRVGLAVPLLGTAAELRDMVAREGDVPPQQVILAEVSPQGSLRSLGDAEELGTAGQGAPLYALQAPPEPPAGTRHGGGGAGWGSRDGLSPGPCPCPRGCPLHMQSCGHVVPPGYGTLPWPCWHCCSWWLQADSRWQWGQLPAACAGTVSSCPLTVLSLQDTGPLFRIRVAGDPGTYLSPRDAQPLCHPAIERALQQSAAGGPPHVGLTVEWDLGTKERLFGSVQEEPVRDADSVRLQQEAHQQHSCTLDECFQLYTQEEQV